VWCPAPNPGRASCRHWGRCPSAGDSSPSARAGSHRHPRQGGVASSNPPYTQKAPWKWTRLTSRSNDPAGPEEPSVFLVDVGSWSAAVTGGRGAQSHADQSKHRLNKLRDSVIAFCPDKLNGLRANFRRLFRIKWLRSFDDGRSDKHFLIRSSSEIEVEHIREQLSQDGFKTVFFSGQDSLP
jgi:hypothetical protein